MIEKRRARFCAQGKNPFLNNMNRRRQDIHWQVLSRSRLLAIVLALGGLLLSVNFGRMVTRDRMVRREIARLEGEVDRMESEYRRLEETRNFFRTDFFREQESRKSLGYARAGEKVVVIEGFAPKIDGARPETELSNPQKWWKYLFHVKS